MKIVKSQDLRTSIPLSQIIRTTIEKKAEDLWIITATLQNDRPVTLARFPSEKEALKADIEMWLSSGDVYGFRIFPKDWN